MGLLALRKILRYFSAVCLNAPKLSAEQIAMGQRLIAEGSSVRDAAHILNCHHATLYRAVNAYK